MIVAKLDLLLKHLGERAEFKKHRENYARAMESHFACEVCGNEGLLTLLKVPIYVLQAHGSCSFSLRVFPQGLSIHGTSVLLCLTKH